MKANLKTKMILWIWGMTTIILCGVLLSHFYFSRNLLTTALKSNAANVALYYDEKFQKNFARVEMIPRMGAEFINASRELTQKDMDRYLEGVLKENRFIYGMGFAFMKGGFAPGVDRFASYCHRGGGSFRILRLEKVPGYNYTGQDWFSIPVKTGKSSWSEPYYDREGGNVTMTTYSVPIKQDGAIRGVATGDLCLEELTDRINKVRLLDTGYGFMVSPGGRFLSFPDRGRLMTGKIQDINRELARKMTVKGGGFLETKDPLRGETAWVFYEDVGDTGFSVAFVYPKAQVLCEVRSLQQNTLALGGIGLLGLLVVIVLISDSITGPVSRLVNGVSTVARGNLDHEIPISSSTWEVEQLGDSINQMIRDLKAHIESLRTITAEKERIAKELSLAREIQLSASPRDFSCLPDTCGLRVFATMLPALEVGGDFYDIFTLPDGRIGFVIGDASGKGIPAALYVTRSMAYLKSAALQGLEPGTCLKSVNRLLCYDESLSMFVTLFYGILDPVSGELTYCNGGHNPPYLLSEDGSVCPLTRRGGLVLGVMDGVKYKSETVSGVQGIFLYTDGVTEAEDPDLKQFTESRLRDVLAEASGNDPKKIVDMVGLAVKEFVRGAPRSDDLTMLAITCNLGDKNEC